MHSRGLRTLRARPSVTSSRAWSTVRPVAAARRDTHGGGGGDGGGAERGDPTYDDDPDGPSIVPRAPDVSDGRWCGPPPHPGAMPTDAVSRAVLQRATAPRGVNSMDTTHMRGGAALLVARAHRAQCNAIRVRGRGGAGGAGPGNAASHDTVRHTAHDIPSNSSRGRGGEHAACLRRKHVPEDHASARGVLRGGAGSHGGLSRLRALHCTAPHGPTEFCFTHAGH